MTNKYRVQTSHYQFVIIEADSYRVDTFGVLTLEKQTDQFTEYYTPEHAVVYDRVNVATFASNRWDNIILEVENGQETT